MACLALAKLVNRRILRISGPDCYSYLQGLVSNDLTYLYEPDKVPRRRHAKATPNVISSFMLNAQGRAICDLLLYRTPNTRFQCEFLPPGKATEPDELLIECDSSLASGLANTLYGYRVRRKITLAMEEQVSVWCLFPHLTLANQSPTPPLRLTSEETALEATKEIIETKELIGHDLTVVNDPRLASLGMRIIARGDKSFEDIKRSCQSFMNIDIREATQKDYTKFRYALGVGEGVLDHPESNCLPLECNADLLGSVSFNKGCYLGQELTARIHYTGVIRKRLMPLVLDRSTSSQELGALPLVNGSDIVIEETKKKVGVLRNVVQDRGLAMLKISLVEDGAQLIHEGSKTKVSTYKPFWWSELELKNSG